MLIYTPNAPTVSANNLITSSRVDLTITPPGSNGGSVITSYKIYINGSYTGSIGYAGTIMTYQAISLSASTQYTFTVTAVNEIGEGSPSAGSITTTLNAPSVTATAVSSSQVNLTISPPTNNIQRNPITSYKIYINDVYKDSATADSSYKATYQATGLTAGTLYSFTVRAVSIDGDGANSAAATATPVPPLNPVKIPGLLLWLDADDLTTFTPSNITNNTDITKWLDKSGNQNHCTPTGYANNPTMNNPKYNETGQSGKRSVYLNSSKLVGTFSSSYRGQSVIIFAVMKPTNEGPSSVGRLMSFGTLNQTDYQDISAVHISGSSTNGSYGFGSLRSTPSWSPARNAHFESPNCLNVSTLVELTSNPTEHTMQINGGATSMSDSSGGLINNFNFVNYTIGGDLIQDDAIMSGYLSEVLVFGNTLTTSQKQKVEGYLAIKWGLQSSLPTNHPYKSALPVDETIMFGQKIRFYTDNTTFGLSSAGIEVYSSPGDSNLINSGLTVTTKNSYSVDSDPSKWIDNTSTAWIALPEAGQYVEVDLGFTVPIYKIALYNRVDNYGQRNNGSRLQIKDGSNNQLYLSNVLTDLSGSSVPNDGNSTFSNWTFYPSNPIWNGTNNSLPIAPTVTAAVVGTTIILTITAQGEGKSAITSYNVYINGSTTSAGFTTTNTYSVSGLTAGTPYSFTVSAVNTAGEGAKSTAITATPIRIFDNPTVVYYYNQTTITVPNNDRMDVLVVGGGGGGQEGYGPYVSGINQPGGGGGSAGGITYVSGITLTDGTITITPGSGGGGGNYGIMDYGNGGIAGTNGSASSVIYKTTTISAPGGIGATSNTGTLPPSNTNTGAQTSFGTSTNNGNYPGVAGAGWSFAMPNVSTISYGGGAAGLAGYYNPGGNGSYGGGGGGGNGCMSLSRLGRYAAAGGNGGGGVIVIYYYNSVPNAATVAIAPTISANPNTSSQITVWITPPLYNGGSPIIKYKVYMNGVYIGETTTTVYYATGLSPGTRYTFKVSTVNGVGEGPQSAEAAASTYVVVTV